MRSAQMLANRRAVHTVGITQQGILYIDIESFGKNQTREANTFYVRAADVARIKSLVFPERGGAVTDMDLLRLFVIGFRDADTALEWLRRARIPTVHRHDKDAGCNAEENIPPAAHTSSGHYWQVPTGPVNPPSAEEPTQGPDGVPSCKSIW